MELRSSASKSPPATRTSSLWSKTRNSPSTTNPGKQIGAEICVHQDFPHHTNVEFVRIVERARNRDSHLRARRRPHRLFRHRHAAPQPPRCWLCAAVFLRSPSLLPAARRPSHGTDPARSCSSPDPPLSSPAARPGNMAERSAETIARSPPARASVSSRPHPSRSLSASNAAWRHCVRSAYAPKPSQNALERGPLYFAGTPEQRLADLHAAFADEAPAPSCACAAATDLTTCSMAWTSNDCRTSQALLRLQRPDRHSTAPAR